MPELTELELDRIFIVGMAKEAEGRAQFLATSADMTARLRESTRRTTPRRPLIMMAAALLIGAGVVTAVIGTRPNMPDPLGSPANCLSTLPDGWRLRLNLAIAGTPADIVTLDRDGRLIRGPIIAGYAPLSSWLERPRSTIRQLSPTEADALVTAVDEAFPEGFCGTIAGDPTQASSPSIEADGNHFVMVNGSATQRSRVSSAEEIRQFTKLLGTLRDLITNADDAPQLYDASEYDLTVMTYPGPPVGPDVGSVILPGGTPLAEAGRPVEYPLVAGIFSESRCQTISGASIHAYVAALDNSNAWSDENAAWLYSTASGEQTIVRVNERRPHQGACEEQPWPGASVDTDANEAKVALDPCGLISPDDTALILGRPAQGEYASDYFPETDSCVFSFGAADRAPHVLGIRPVETRHEQFQSLAEFYLGTDGLTTGESARGYKVFFNGCESTGTQAKCAAVVASEPYLAVIYLPFSNRDEAPGLLRQLVDALAFPTRP